LAPAEEAERGGRIPREHRGGRQADAQHPGFAAVRAAGMSHGALTLCERRSSSLDESSACRREPCTAWHAGEETDFELALQIADLLRERLLRQVEPRRGPREAPFVGDRDRVAQVLQIHAVGSPASREPATALGRMPRPLGPTGFTLLEIIVAV